MLQWNCVNPFCIKRFSSKRGQEKHYESTACGLHGLTASRPLERRLSAFERSKHAFEGEESLDLLASEDQWFQDDEGESSSDPYDSGDEVSGVFDENETIDENEDFLADGPLILEMANSDSSSFDGPESEVFIEEYIGAAQVIGHGPNYYEQLLEANECSRTSAVANEPPFSGGAELELVKILDPLSKSKIDEFLRSEYVSLG